MSQDEQTQQAQLREQLTNANTEARLYRGLFWSLLTLAMIGAIVHLLQR
jgi:hypothetical protein